jgi:pimeloyl-ACP methyl ester carboxylesterase
VSLAVLDEGEGAPVLLLHGFPDSSRPWRPEEGMPASGDHVTGPWHYERIEGAGRLLQLDAPERVNELLLGFLTER